MCPETPPERFRSQKLVIVVVDLGGYARAFRRRSDSEMAEFLDRYYQLAGQIVSDEGGTIIKFMGDAVLATFELDQAPTAVRAVMRLEAAMSTMAAETDYSIDVGSNIHIGSAVTAELGSGPNRRWDVVGRGVNQTFLLGDLKDRRPDEIQQIDLIRRPAVEVVLDVEVDDEVIALEAIEQAPEHGALAATAVPGEEDDRGSTRPQRRSPLRVVRAVPSARSPERGADYTSAPETQLVTWKPLNYRRD